MAKSKKAFKRVQKKRAAEIVQLREMWLTKLSALIVPVITDRGGVSFPSYRVTCGFPSRGGELGKKTRVRGQCWAAASSDDKHAEVFISPVEDDANEIGEILAHELIHAALPDAGHGKTFQAAARAIGFEKPFTSSHPTPDFTAWIKPLIAQCGRYPHRKLNAMVPVAQRKKQGARMIKCECDECGYVARTTRKWIDEHGAPFCGVLKHGRMTANLPDEGEED